MAYLGWRPSGDAGSFHPYRSRFTRRRTTPSSYGYENAKGPVLVFEPAIADSVWPVEARRGTMDALPVRTPARTRRCRPVNDYQWDFGDGQTATGPEVDHVYLTLEQRTVTLTAQGPAGTQTARWPLSIFEIEHVTDQFKEGRPKDYAKLAKGYDRAKLSADALRKSATSSGRERGAGRVGRSRQDVPQRFPKGRALTQARVRRLDGRSRRRRMGEAIWTRRSPTTRPSLVKETPAAEKLDVLARLIRLVGVEREQPDKAAPIFAQGGEAVKSATDGRRRGATAAVSPGRDRDGRRAVVAGQTRRGPQSYAKAEKLCATPFRRRCVRPVLGPIPTRFRSISTPATPARRLIWWTNGTRCFRPTSRTATVLLARQGAGARGQPRDAVR